MVDEDFHIQIIFVVAVHDKTTSLGETVQVRWMGVERALGFNALETDPTSALISVAIHDDLVKRPIVIVELSKWTDHLVHHGSVEPLCRAILQVLAHTRHSCLFLGSRLFQLLLSRSIGEIDLAAGMLHSWLTLFLYELLG